MSLPCRNRGSVQSWLKRRVFWHCHKFPSWEPSASLTSQCEVFDKRVGHPPRPHPPCETPPGISTKMQQSKEQPLHLLRARVPSTLQCPDALCPTERKLIADSADLTGPESCLLPPAHAFQGCSLYSHLSPASTSVAGTQHAPIKILVDKQELLLRLYAEVSKIRNKPTPKIKEKN